MCRITYEFIISHGPSKDLPVPVHLHSSEYGHVTRHVTNMWRQKLEAVDQNPTVSSVSRANWQVRGRWQTMYDCSALWLDKIEVHLA